MTYEETINDYREFREFVRKGGAQFEEYTEQSVCYLAYVVNELNKNLVELISELKRNR